MNEKTITRRYIFSQAELREKLGMEGEEIKSIGLWSGRSPNDEEEGLSSDTDTYFIETIEKHLYPSVDVEKSKIKLREKEDEKRAKELEKIDEGVFKNR